MGAFSRFFKGTPAKTEQIQRYNPQQQAILDQITQMALGQLQDPSTGIGGEITQRALSQLDNPGAGFDPIAEKARSDYRTKDIPYLAERFASMGQGAGRSSGFRAALQGGAQDLDESLAAQRAQYGLQGRGLAQQLLGMGLGHGQQERSLIQQLLGMGLGQRFDSIYQPSQKGFIQSSLEQAPGRLMKMGGAFLGL